MDNLGHVTVTFERRWLMALLKFFHLFRYSWARRLAYYDVTRRITDFDHDTQTYTVDKPFPEAPRPGQVYKWDR